MIVLLAKKNSHLCYGKNYSKASSFFFVDFHELAEKKIIPKNHPKNNNNNNHRHELPQSQTKLKFNFATFKYKSFFRVQIFIFFHQRKKLKK